MQEHLRELRTLAGLLQVDPKKEDRIAKQFLGLFEREEGRELSFRMQLDRADAEHAIRMGPSAYHIDEGKLSSKLAEAAFPIEVSGRVRIEAYRPCPVPKLW
jgi:23S rRNA (guanine745-N1)-methyltransferase